MRDLADVGRGTHDLENLFARHGKFLRRMLEVQIGEGRRDCESKT
jgi:hypothetical protein